MQRRLGRDTALLNLYLGARWWWVVNSTPQPLYPLEKYPVLIVQEARWAPGPV